MSYSLLFALGLAGSVQAFVFRAEMLSIGRDDEQASPMATSHVFSEYNQSCDAACAASSMVCSDTLLKTNLQFGNTDVNSLNSSVQQWFGPIFCGQAIHFPSAHLPPNFHLPLMFVVDELGDPNLYDCYFNDDVIANCAAVNEDTNRICACTGAAGGAAARGDPHATFQGHNVDFNMPETHYVKLLEQNGLSIFGLGGAPSVNVSSNFMYSVFVRVADDEIVRVDQKKDADLLQSQLDVLVQGKPYVATNTVSTINIPGHSDVALKISDNRVVLEHDKLKVLIRSASTHWDKPTPNHLDFVVEEGLDVQEARGVLPELWGLRPMSGEVKSMLD